MGLKGIWMFAALGSLSSEYTRGCHKVKTASDWVTDVDRFVEYARGFAVQSHIYKWAAVDRPSPSRRLLSLKKPWCRRKMMVWVFVFGEFIWSACAS